MKGKRKNPTIFFALIILVSVIYGSIELTNSKSIKAKKINEYNENETKIESLENDIKNLKETINESGSEEFIEKVARQEYKMVKPREVIYIDKEQKNNWH